MGLSDEFDSRIPEGMRDKYRSMRGVVSDTNLSLFKSESFDDKSSRIDVSWEDYIEDLEDLSLRVGRLGNFTCVYGLHPHGIFPALYLSFQLGKRLVTGAEVILELEESPDSLLVVDGSCSDGVSLIPYRVKVKTAVIYLEPSNKRVCSPEVAVIEVAGRVKFPYEQKVSK